MKDYKHIERIESFLMGEMKSEDKNLFQQELASNEELKKEYELYLKSNQAVHHLKRQYLKKKIQAYTKPNIQESKNASLRKIIIKTAIVIFIILALLILSSYFYANKNYCNKCLADLQSFELLNELNRGIDESKEIKLNSIAQLMHQEQYNRVLDELTGIDSLDYFPSFLFLKTKALIKKEDFSEAKDVLRKIQSSEDKLIKDLADWQMVQTMLLSNNGSEANQLLHGILSSDGHGYYKKARRLKKQLSSPLRRWIQE